MTLRAGDRDRSGGVGEVVGPGFGEVGRGNTPRVPSLGKKKTNAPYFSAGGLNHCQTLNAVESVTKGFVPLLGSCGPPSPGGFCQIHWSI